MIEKERRYLLNNTDFTNIFIDTTCIEEPALTPYIITQYYKNDQERFREILNLLSSGAWFRTVKGPKINGCGYEYETAISLEEYTRSIIGLTRKIVKNRYKFIHKDCIIDIDIYRPPLPPIAILEIEYTKEFPNEVLKNIRYDLIDITDDHSLSNSNLSKISKEELQEILNRYNYKINI